MPWRGVPVMPVEIMLLPRWFPFHLDKVSYWARTVLVPLLVLQALKPRPKNPRGVGIAELFADAARPGARLAAGAAPDAGPGRRSSAPSTRSCKGSSRFSRSGSRRRAIEQARGLRRRAPERRGRPRRDLSGHGQRGADVRRARLSAGPPEPSSPRAQSIDGLLVVKEDEAYCQPCLSPVWDTALACHALLEVGGEAAERQARARPRLAEAAAGARRRAATGPCSAPTCGRAAGPSSTPTRTIPTSTTPPSSSWPWTGRSGACRRRTPPPSPSRSRAGANGSRACRAGTAAGPRSTPTIRPQYLNHIPFADHGALLDPPTADVTARCVSMLAQLGETRRNEPGFGAGVAYLLRRARKRTAAGSAAGA